RLIVTQDNGLGKFKQAFGNAAKGGFQVWTMGSNGVFAESFFEAPFEIVFKFPEKQIIVESALPDEAFVRLIGVLGVGKRSFLKINEEVNCFAVEVFDFFGVFCGKDGVLEHFVAKIFQKQDAVLKIQVVDFGNGHADF